MYINLKNKGMTLMELIIVIIIIAILAIVSINVYRTLLFRSVSTEAKALMGTVAKAEKLYWVERGAFYAPPNGEISYDDILGVDARANKYFRTFEIIEIDPGLNAKSTAQAPYEGLVLSLTIDNMLNNDTKATMVLTNNGSVEAIETL